MLLTWMPGGPPTAITRYVLEAGSAPGLNDIISGLDVGLHPSFAARRAAGHVLCPRARRE